jgi:hypothetical protein
VAVQVSYLTISGPRLWGSVGSIVTEPGEGRWLILRHLDPLRGPEGYFVVDLLTAAVVTEVVANEMTARAEVERLHREARREAAR